MATQLFPEYHVIIVPGLHDSSPHHWQSRRQRRHAQFSRVQQADRARRLRGELFRGASLGHIKPTPDWTTGMPEWPSCIAWLIWRTMNGWHFRHD